MQDVDFSDFEPHIAHQLNEVVECVVKTVPTRRIILFGSYARGDAREGSDIDLYVLTGGGKKRSLEYLREVYRGLNGAKSVPMDILLKSQEQFYERAAMRPTLEYTVAREGRIIYDNK